MDTTKDWQSGTSMNDGIKIMFENNLGTDVTFSFSGSHEKLGAHKVILMARSHVFFTMFSSPLQDPSKDIEITDIELEDFKGLLKFLYYNEVEIDSENAFHLLYSAQKYEVEVLKTKCINFLYQMLNYDTAGPILDQAVFYDEYRLIRTCMDFFSDNATASLKRLNGYHLTRESLQLILECDTLGVNEVCVFEACASWAEEECRIRDIPVDPENKRIILGPLLKKIRFCSMTHVEMASVVSPLGLLTPDEELETFRFLGNPDKTQAPFPHEKRRPLELYAMMPTDICMESQKNDGLNLLKDFHISVTCPRAFTLIGFVFNQKGQFQVKLNHTVTEKFSLCEKGVYVYLTKPLHCYKKNTIDIQVDNNGRRTKNTVKLDTHKILCKTTPSTEDNNTLVLNVKRYNGVLLPFDGLLLTL